MKHRLRVGAVALVGLLAAAGCSDDSQDAAPTTEPVAESSSTTSPSTTAPYQSTQDGNVRMLTPDTINVTDTIVIDIANACDSRGDVSTGVSFTRQPDNEIAVPEDQLRPERFRVSLLLVPPHNAGIVQLPMPTGTPPGLYVLEVWCDQDDAGGRLFEANITVTGERIRPTNRPASIEAEGRTITATIHQLGADPPSVASASAVWTGETRFAFFYDFQADPDLVPLINATIIVPDYFPTGTYDAWVTGINATPHVEADPVTITIG